MELLSLMATDHLSRDFGRQYFVDSLLRGLAESNSSIGRFNSSANVTYGRMDNYRMRSKQAFFQTRVDHWKQLTSENWGPFDKQP